MKASQSEINCIWCPHLCVPVSLVWPQRQKSLIRHRWRNEWEGKWDVTVNVWDVLRSAQMLTWENKYCNIRKEDKDTSRLNEKSDIISLLVSVWEWITTLMQPDKINFTFTLLTGHIESGTFSLQCTENLWASFQWTGFNAITIFPDKEALTTNQHPHSEAHGTADETITQPLTKRLELDLFRTSILLF